MPFKYDPFAVLGLAQGASASDVKHVYHRLAQRIHPDRNPFPAAALQFADATEAYSLLTTDRLESPRAANPDDEHYFTLRVTPSKRTLATLSEDQVIYLLAEIAPAVQASASPAQETPLNITLVLDHSNSMKGTRIERVKIAAQKIIDGLSANDSISVVIFNDRATLIIPATRVTDKTSLKARVSMISASGGTEIYQGLAAGLEQNKVAYNTHQVNHIILLTDGHTFGDQERCLELAHSAVSDGIGISAMGLGSDWNDEFLDKIAAATGGSSLYINSTEAVVKYLNNQVRNLANAYAERLQLSIAPDPDIRLDMAFKLMPNPQPLDPTSGIIPLASLPVNRSILALFQFTLPPNLKVGFRNLCRIAATGDIFQRQQQAFIATTDVSIEISEHPTSEEPPPAIMDALSKLTLYRLQERAREAMERGDVNEATRRLENLATRLFEMGQHGLAQETLSEAQRVAQTKAFSEVGKKTIKYETRALIGHNNIGEMISKLLSTDE